MPQTFGRPKSMKKENILSLIPQRSPFIMIDELLHCDETITQTTFRIKEENVLVIEGKFTEAGLMENIAQTAAAREGFIGAKENKPVTTGYIGAVKNFEVYGLPRVNDLLLTEIKIQEQVFDMVIISGTVKCNDVLMARCEMNIFTGE